MASRVKIFLCLAILLLPAWGVPEDGGLAIIVHPDRQASIGIDDVAQIYLRRRRFWDDGAAIVPLNVTAGTSVRTAFSSVVLRLDDAGLVDYWNRQYYYGIRPPSTLASTAAMKRYVSLDPNAIGYVRASEVDDSVRVVLLLR